MLPGPTMAAVASWSSHPYSLLEARRRAGRTRSRTPRTRRRGVRRRAVRRAGQDHVTRLEGDPEATRPAGQPAHRGHRVAEQAAPFRRPSRRCSCSDMLDVAAARCRRACDPSGPRTNPAAGRVVGDGVGDPDVPVGDPAVDQLDRRGDGLAVARRRPARCVLARATSLAEDERDLDLDPRVAVAAAETGAVTPKLTPCRRAGGRSRARRRPSSPASPSRRRRPCARRPWRPRRAGAGCRQLDLVGGDDVVGAGQVAQRRRTATGSPSAAARRRRPPTIASERHGGHTRTCYSFAP